MNFKKLSFWLSLLLLIAIAGASPSINYFFSLLIVISIVGILLYFSFLLGKLELYHYLVILIPLIILSPPISITSNLPALRLDDFWLLFGAMIYVTSITIKRSNHYLKWSRVNMLFIAFGFWVFFTILMSSFTEPFYYLHSDWLEVYKLIKLFVILSLVSAITNKHQIIKLADAIIFFIFIAALIGLMQKFGLAELPSAYQVDKFLISDRVVSTFGNPNIFAGALIVGISLTLSKLMVKASVKDMLFLSVMLYAIFLTVSRTGLVMLMVVFLSVFIVSVFRNRETGKILVTSAFVLVLGFYIVTFMSESFFKRTERLSSINSDTSFMTRVENWQGIFKERTSNHIVTGTGPTGSLRITFDNEWLEILTYYGIVGLLIFVLLFLALFFRMNKSQFYDTQWIQVGAQAMVVAFAFYMITASVYHALQLMPLVMFSISLAYRLHIKSPTMVEY